MEKIPFVFMPTQKAYDSYYFAKNVDLSMYSLLAACGGDGTHHEVANGMIQRTD